MTGALNAKTRLAVLQIAEWQEGVVEMPSNSNKVKYNTAYYGREVSGRAYPWCMTFVWWVFREAGFSLYKTASCTAFVNRYRVYAPRQIVTRHRIFRFLRQPQKDRTRGDRGGRCRQHDPHH